MSDEVPIIEDRITQIVEDDPVRPNKAFGSAVGSALGYGLSNNLFGDNPWVVGAVTLVAAFVGAYFVKNPKKYIPTSRRKPPGGRRRGGQRIRSFGKISHG